MDEVVDAAPTMPEVAVNLCRANAPVRVPLAESQIVTAETSPNFVRHVTFDVGGTPLEGRLLAGQSFGIVPPGNDADGKPHKLRLYSVSSPSRGEKGGGRLASTLVKRVLEEHGPAHRLYLGVCSNYLCDLQVGDEVEMTGPAGKRFLLPVEPDKHNYVFFATGTGIAPFRAMVLDLLAAGVTNARIHLIVGVPYRTDHLYHDLFTGPARELPGFRYRSVVSREDRRMDGFKRYVHHEIGEDEELRETLAQPNTLIYVCGIKNMESAIYRELLKAGLDNYITLRHPPEGKEPLQYTNEEFHRHLRPSPRMFLEVY
ncbi:MAG: FAD-binding oxidoreductase [Gammaproteobacteria bacterium]